MQEPVRVLHVLSVLKFGGAQSFILNNYKNIDKQNIQFDFIVRSANNDPQYIKLIEEMGGKVFYLPKFPQNIIQNYKMLGDIFKKHSREYIAIHVHANSLLYLKPLELAKKYGIKTRIIHSHNSKPDKAIYTLLHTFNKVFIINKLVTKKLACSALAGKWLFGNNEFEIVKNSIEIDNFIYNPEKRQRIREWFDLKDKFVIGHIGRFVKAKNHRVIVEIFNYIKKDVDNAILMLVGSGALENDIKSLVSEKKLEKSVIFVGTVNNTYDYMQAMDVFLNPSLYEGLPFTLIEAQTAGLPCVISANVTDEICITNLISKISLKEPIEIWANEICKYYKYIRYNTLDEINNSGYNVKETAKKLEKLYMEYR